MTRTPRVVLVVAAMVGAASLGGLGALARPGAGETSLDPGSVAQTSFPGLAAASGEPQLDGIDSAAPAPGRVVAVAGPFDDRFTLADLKVGQGAVSGRLEVHSDVSDLLELQVVAGFYDAEGILLGTGRATYHLDEATADPSGQNGPPAEVGEFRVEAPRAYAGRVAAATVGVPVLVNE